MSISVLMEDYRHAVTMERYKQADYYWKLIELLGQVEPADEGLRNIREMRKIVRGEV